MFQRGLKPCSQTPLELRLCFVPLGISGVSWASDPAFVCCFSPKCTWDHGPHELSFDLWVLKCQVSRVPKNYFKTEQTPGALASAWFVWMRLVARKLGSGPSRHLHERSLLPPAPQFLFL